MDAKAELGPQRTRRKLFTGISSGLAAIGLGRMALSRSKNPEPPTIIPVAAVIEEANIALPMNPYEGLLSESSPHGKFITDPKLDPNRVVRTLETPDEYVYIDRFVNPIPGKTNGITLRRFPFHTQPKGQEEVIEDIDPKNINPDGFVVVRVSGEDYGGGNSITINHKGTIASGAVWYLIGKMVPLDSKSAITRFTPVNPFTGKPLERMQKKELPYVMSRNMFEPKSQKWNSLTTAKTEPSTFSK